MTYLSGRGLAILLLLFVSMGCAGWQTAQRASALKGIDVSAMAEKIPNEKLGDPHVRRAIEALGSGNYVVAQKALNHALKYDPANPHLHFLNGLTYHLRAAEGDSSQLIYAEIGYKLALQYDPANYWAAYQLGHVKYGQQHYQEAQDAFAYALLFDPDNPQLLKALTAASYYAQDLETAWSALSKAERIVPKDPKVLYDTVLINAALGRFDEAKKRLARYRALPGGRYRLRSGHLTHRLNDWQRFYAFRKPGLQLAQAPSVLGPQGTETGLQPGSGGGSGSGGLPPISGGDPPPKNTLQMTLVDVVIIRSEERRSTGKGVNLLQGLQLTLGGSDSILSFSSVLTNTENFRGGTAGAPPNTSSRVKTTTFRVPPVGIPSVNYSLNIFNNNDDFNQVLARPSLIALDGQTSEFFTGAVFHVELDGIAGSQGTVTDVPVGIRLKVTPKFMGKGMIQLQVEAGRAFVENRSSQVGFNNFAQITKTLVTANVAMRFGQTLVISGLSEKETENVTGGVPLLQDIPVVQYLFSRQDTLDFTKSIVVLLTPRKPRYTYEDGSAKVSRKDPPDAGAGQLSLKELKERPDWFRPAPNLDSVFYHLRDNRFFKEFRTGDVSLERWENPRDLQIRIQRTLEFLYF